MLPVYFFSLLIVVAGFLAYPLISKKYIGGIGYKKFLPIFLGLTALGSFIPPLLVYHSFPVALSVIPLLALLGAMYTAAAYFVFYSLERYNLGIINSIIGSQQALIAFFDALLFIESELRDIIIPFIIIISGIFIVGKSSAGKSRFSKYIILAFIGTLLWVFMWVLFYTINTKYPLSYYAVIQSFAFLFCLPVTWLIADKKAKKEKYGEKMKFIVVAGLMNGIASGIFSFAYKFNALLTPFIVQLTVPLVLILSFLLLKERLKKLELVGVILIILGTFIYIVI